MATAAESIPVPARLTPEEYLERERAAEYKSEYAGGEIVAMSGAKEAHVLITWNTGAALHAQLRGRPCRAYVSDMRVAVATAGSYRYPDVVALCEVPRFLDERRDTLLNPSVIVEVLSASTEKTDRIEKWAEYRRLESLQEYVLVAQDQMRVECYRRHGDVWIFRELSEPDAVLELPSVGCAVALRDVYERVEFGVESPEPGSMPAAG